MLRIGFLLKLLFAGVLSVGMLTSCQQTEPSILEDVLNRQLTGKFKFLSKKTIFNIVDISAGEDIGTFVDSVVIQIKYPYSLFLKLKNEKRQCDSIHMLRTSHELLSIKTPYERLLYGEEFTKAKKTLDPTYDIANDPYLEVKPAVVEIGQCKYQEKKPFFIILKNTGDST